MTDIEYENLPAGWSRRASIESLYNLVTFTQPSSILEVGTYLGRSAVTMRMAASEASITCVDVWLSPFFRKTSINGDKTPEQVYEEFLANTKDHNIKAIKGNILSPSLQGTLDTKYDMTFVDVDREQSVLWPTMHILWHKCARIFAGCHYGGNTLVTTFADRMADKVGKTVNTEAGLWWITK